MNWSVKVCCVSLLNEEQGGADVGYSMIPAHDVHQEKHKEKSEMF